GSTSSAVTCTRQARPRHRRSRTRTLRPGRNTVIYGGPRRPTNVQIVVGTRTPRLACVDPNGLVRAGGELGFGGFRMRSWYFGVSSLIAAIAASACGDPAGEHPEGSLGAGAAVGSGATGAVGNPGAGGTTAAGGAGNAGGTPGVGGGGNAGGTNPAGGSGNVGGTDPVPSGGGGATPGTGGTGAGG